MNKKNLNTFLGMTGKYLIFFTIVIALIFFQIFKLQYSKRLERIETIHENGLNNLRNIVYSDYEEIFSDITIFSNLLGDHIEKIGVGRSR